MWGVGEGWHACWLCNVMSTRITRNRINFLVKHTWRRDGLGEKSKMANFIQHDTADAAMIDFVSCRRITLSPRVRDVVLSSIFSKRWALFNNTVKRASLSKDISRRDFSDDTPFRCHDYGNFWENPFQKYFALYFHITNAFFHLQKDRTLGQRTMISNCFTGLAEKGLIGKGDGLHTL